MDKLVDKIKYKKICVYVDKSLQTIHTLINMPTCPQHLMAKNFFTNPQTPTTKTTNLRNNQKQP